MNAVDPLPLVAELVERIAYLMPTGVDPAPPASWAAVAEVVWYRVDGTASGRVQLALDAAAAAAAATNMLGLKPSVPPTQGDLLDVTKEMANVLAGNLLPALQGEAEYRLESPVTCLALLTDASHFVALTLVEGHLAVALCRDHMKPAAPPKPTIRILIAEDDFVSRTVLQHQLEKIGTCDLVINGQEAVDAFTRAWQEGRPYQLVCLDVMMPVKDGQTALRDIRRLEQDRGIRGDAAAKIIMTTALDDPGSIMTAFRGQCEAYLVKPIDEMLMLQHLHVFGLVWE